MRKITKLRWAGMTLAGLSAAMLSNVALADTTVVEKMQEVKKQGMDKMHAAKVKTVQKAHEVKVQGMEKVHAMVHPHHPGTTVHRMERPHGMQASSTGGLKVWESKDGPYWFRLGGRLMFDEALYSGKNSDKGNDFASGAAIRRARLVTNGGIAANWSYDLELEYSNLTSPTAASGVSTKIIFAYVQHNGHRFSDSDVFRVGQIKPYFGQEYTADNINYAFMESSLAANVFRPDTSLGAQFHANFDNKMNLQLAVFQPGANTGTSPVAGNGLNSNGKADRWGATARATFSPVHDHESLFHVGASAYHQTLAATQANRSAPLLTPFPGFAVNNELQSRNSNNNLLGYSADRISQYQLYNAEAAVGFGPALVQAEYLTGNVKRHWNKNGNVRPHGYHLQAGYLLTGEVRPYDPITGVFGRPKPMTEAGAWEVVGRWSFINLNQKDQLGGTQHNGTLGVNWYVNENVRVAANYIRSSIHGKLNAPKRKIDALGLRLQATW